MGTVWLIAGKDLKQRLRDRSAIMLAVVLPLALAFIYNLIFGGAATPRPFRFAVSDLDRGQVSQAFAAQLLPHIETEGYIQLRQAMSRDEARRLVDDGTVDAAFVIPQGFPNNGGIEVIGSSDSPTGADVARAIAESYMAELNYVRVALVAVGTGTVGPDQLAQRALATAKPLILQDVSARQKILSIKAYFAGGMAVFFLFFTVQYGVTSILDERELGTLRRLLAAPISPRAVLVGKLLTSFLLGLISMAVLVVATAAFMGVQWGNPVGLGLLIICGVTAATGVTALVASLARTAELAGGMQSVIAVVLGMLGGAFFPISQIGGVVATLSLLTPHAWFLRGLAELAGGGSVAETLPAAGAMLTFAAVTLGLALTRLGKLVQP